MPPPNFDIEAVRNHKIVVRTVFISAPSDAPLAPFFAADWLTYFMDEPGSWEREIARREEPWDLVLDPDLTEDESFALSPWIRSHGKPLKSTGLRRVAASRTIDSVCVSML